ncbi:MAG: hypothetical protein ABIJ56_23885 [Pseudomonadota bacterium]
MKSGKGRGAIEKVVRLRKHEEREAAAGLLVKKRQLAELDGKVREAEDELAKRLHEAQERRADLKKSLGGEMKASRAAGRLSHIRSIEEACNRIKGRIAMLQRDRGRVESELERERRNLAEKFADKRSAQKYLESLEKEAEQEKEKKQEDGD